jgi:hypothetical protein
MTIAEATGYELAVGLPEPKKSPDHFLAWRSSNGRDRRQRVASFGKPRPARNRSADRSPRLRVELPAEPPKLTPEATGSLLEILCDAWEEKRTE